MFLRRLRLTRCKSVDRLRQIVETYDNDTQYTTLRELRKILLSDKEASGLISSDEVNDLLKEVEQELRDVSLEYEVEKYTTENQKEVEDAVDRLMDICQICGNLSFEIICPKCNSQISSDLR